MNYVVNDNYGDNHKCSHPEKICVTGYCEASGAAHLIDIKNYDANYLCKAEGDDRQIVSAQSQRGNTDHQSGQGRDQCSHQNS